MKCTIVAGNIRVFGKAIHSLSKIGTELYLEDCPNGLALKTVNQSRCGYASINLLKDFFHQYDSGLEAGDDDTGRIKCKLCMKACLAIFKNLSTTEKMVEQCTLSYEGYDTKFTIHLSCKYGIVKKYELNCLESDVLQAVFDKSSCPNVIGAPLKLLSDAVAPLPNNLEEVTLCAAEDSAILKNYVEDEEMSDTIKVMHTEMKLEEAEFDSYTIESTTEVTFVLRELRAALIFADTSDMPIRIHFSKSGHPIIFTIESPQMYEANYVMATLADDSVPSRSGSQSVRSSGKPKRPTSRNNSIEIMTDTTDNEQVANGVTKPTNSRTSHEQLQVNAGTTTGRIATANPICRLSEDNEMLDELSDTIPQSPPSKRFRSIFTSVTQPKEDSFQVLASDTDDET